MKPDIDKHLLGAFYILVTARAYLEDDANGAPARDHVQAAIEHLQAAREALVSEPAHA